MEDCSFVLDNLAAFPIKICWNCYSIQGRFSLSLFLQFRNMALGLSEGVSILWFPKPRGVTLMPNGFENSYLPN